MSPWSQWLRSLFTPLPRRKPRRTTLSMTSLEDRAVPADASFLVVNSWSGGQQGEVAITNESGPAVNGWQISFDYNGTISQFWNAKLVSQSGTRYTFSDVGWNASVPVGGKQAFGFTSTSAAAPTNYTLNGAPLGGPAPNVTISLTGASANEGNPGTPGATTGYFHTSGSQILDSNGQAVKLAGVNWFGLESTTYAPHGLWTRGYKEMMDQMKSLGFNLIRLPFSSQALDPSSMSNGIDYSKNPDLQGLNGLQVMDKIVDYAGQIGLKIMLDHHRSAAGAGADGGLWYEGAYTDARFVSDWAMLATRYANKPAVVAADLHNEPHGAATWGSGDLATDWRLAAERAGNAILAANPNWLIVVEGTERGPSGSYWWGGNLSAAGQFPVRLNTPGRLVYSPHDYPSTIYPQPWFSASNYPNNLNAIWDANWGYLFRTGTAPILIGEFGTKYETASDKVWLDRLTKYLAGDLDNNGTSDLAAGQQGMSWTYWSWNPNSGDTGGILADDWRTVRTDKLSVLQPIQSGLLGNSGGTAANAVSFTVRLSSASSVPITVAYTTQAGTATSGTDYNAVAGTLTFAPGETVKTVQVSVVADMAAEGNESFQVVLSNPTGATIATGTATGTIVDDDLPVSPPSPPPPAPVVSVSDVRANEGNTAGAISFTIRLSAASTSPVTVRFDTQNGTALAGSDFTAVGATITFAPGEIAKTVSIAVLGDTTVEPDETFSIVLTSPVGATLGTSRGTATLVNDDIALPPPPPPPPPTTGGVGKVTSTVGSQWSSGFVLNATVTNNGTTSWKNWTLSFTANYTITNIWGAEIVSRVGNVYTIRPAAYNRLIAPGGSVTFGFQASTTLQLAPKLGDPVLTAI